MCYTDFGTGQIFDIGNLISVWNKPDKQYH